MKLTAVLAGTPRVSATLTALRSAPGIDLAPLANPAGAGQILSGYEAYTDGGVPVTGTAESYDTGFSSGYDIGYDEGYADGYDNGSTEGHYAGYNEGYTAGYDAGCAAGSADKLTYSWDESSLTLTITEV